MTNATNHKTRYSAPALEKGLDILELLADEVEGLSQSDIARRLGRTAGQIFRMLTCLTERGYVHRDPFDDRYRLTSKLFELAHRHPPTQRLLEVAVPHMRELARDLDQSCHLCIRHGDCALVVAQVSGPGPRGFAVRVGAQAPLVDSASGHMLLAFSDDATRDVVLTQARIGARSARRRDLVGRFAEVRRRGYEECRSPYHEGIHDISAPIVDRDGHAVAALTMPYLRTINGAERLAGPRRRLQVCAEAIIKRLIG